MYIDDCRLKGVVNLVLRDENGKVKQHKTIRNKVTRDGIAHIIGRMIDDGQDRAGLHKMPRMMSHMAVGIGAAARSGRDKYTSDNFDSLLQTSAQLGISDSGGTVSDLVTARKQAAIPKSYDKRLQDERGFRVQLMKDTTLASDYAPLQDLLLSQSGSIAMHSLNSAGNSQLKFQAGSGGSPSTVSKLRVGLRLTGLTAGVGISAPGGAQGGDVIPASDDVKISKIESLAGVTTVTLNTALTTQPGSSVDTIYLDVEYVNRIPLTSYTIGDPHPTHTAVRSVMEPPTGAPHPAGPFAAAAARGVSGADYYENGKGMLGITRGQIGAFYERELEYNIILTHTEDDGLPINLTSSPSGDKSKPTTIDEAGFAVLDSGVARFPFIGAEEDKPAGIATAGAATIAGTNTATTRGTEFVQFGTAVDGIFQGALVGSSIIANSSDGTVEGYGPDENNYAQIGGLTSTAAANEQPLASFTSSNALTYAAGTSYTPNAQAGSKKTGDRIVYVATFKENNPRPEVDYDVFDTAGIHRAPLKRVYPITEAGIFNKHIPDLGIFDVGDRTYTGTDANAAELANIDKRGSQAASTSTLTYSVGSGTPTGPVDGTLTQDGKSITAASLGFTKGPVTQTMLCRTTFDPVNKATADTLQITWSVQLQDTTT